MARLQVLNSPGSEEDRGALIEVLLARHPTGRPLFLAGDRGTLSRWVCWLPSDRGPDVVLSCHRLGVP